MSKRLTDKQYLRNGVRISMKTVTIGILEILEINFGHLWGHGQDETELTEEQLAYRERWEEVRIAIKNRGKESQNILLENINNFSIRKIKTYDD